MFYFSNLIIRDYIDSEIIKPPPKKKNLATERSLRCQARQQILSVLCVVFAAV
jgi:hypothetical protein